jgi:hypothetical protein
MDEVERYTLEEAHKEFAKRINGHQSQMKDFDIAYAYEGMARASALGGGAWYGIGQDN